MPSIQPQNLDQDSQRSQFERLIAQYRSRVKEVTYPWFTQHNLTLEEQIDSRLEKPTLLVIEDNTDDWFLIRFGLLRQFPQAYCHWLSDTNQVEAYMEQFAYTDKQLPRLILLDLYLPDSLIGLALLQTIKSHPFYGHVPVVVFSRSVDPIDIAQVFTHSANAYVVKPTQPGEWQTVFTELEPYYAKAHSSRSSLPGE